MLPVGALVVISTVVGIAAGRARSTYGALASCVMVLLVVIISVLATEHGLSVIAICAGCFATALFVGRMNVRRLT